MGDLVPIVVAIVTSIGTIVAAAYGARRISGRNQDGNRNAARWREQAELEEARADLLAEQLREERESHASDLGTLASERVRLATTQHDLDDCSRQRDNAYHRIRELERPARNRGGVT